MSRACFSTESLASDFAQYSRDKHIQSILDNEYSRPKNSNQGGIGDYIRNIDRVIICMGDLLLISGSGEAYQNNVHASSHSTVSESAAHIVEDGRSLLKSNILYNVTAWMRELSQNYSVDVNVPFQKGQLVEKFYDDEHPENVLFYCAIVSHQSRERVTMLSYL